MSEKMAKIAVGNIKIEFSTEEVERVIKRYNAFGPDGLVSTLVEALEKIKRTKDLPAIHTQTWETQAKEWRKACEEVVTMAHKALAAYREAVKK